MWVTDFFLFALFFVIIQHLLELLMIQSDKLAYLTDLSGSRGRTSAKNTKCSEQWGC